MGAFALSAKALDKTSLMIEAVHTGWSAVDHKKQGARWMGHHFLYFANTGTLQWDRGLRHKLQSPLCPDQWLLGRQWTRPATSYQSQ